MDTAVLISCMALTGTLLIVLLLLCRLVQPHDVAWFLSNREDKLKLSKMRLYNANGYLMHSGSEILLGSTGSFQRFDSVDRDYKPQYGPRPGMSAPPWRHSMEEPDIPPQPLRPAPSPKEAKLMREKSIQRQISEPKVPASRSVIISPIPRPVPRKQHSAPISFPLPLLISPQEKRTHPAVQTQVQPLPTSQYHPGTNPFLSAPPLKEESCEGPLLMDVVSSHHPQETVSLPPAPPLTVLPVPATSRLPSPEPFRALKSANNPFIDSPTAVSKRQNQQQQQQQSCVFNFDPAMVQSLFNRQVPGGPLLLANTGKGSTTTNNPRTIASECTINSAAPLTLPPPTVEDDPLRRAHKRLSKMENLRKMSRLIESNQLLLNIYQQFNRTITEQSELSPVVPSHTSKPMLPSSSPAETPLSVSCSPTATAGTDTSLQPEAAECDIQNHAGATNASSGTSISGKYRDSPRSDISDSIRVPTVSRSIKHILRNRSFSETEFSERKLKKTLAILSESDKAEARAQAQPGMPSPSPLVKNASYKDLTRYQRGSMGNVLCAYGSPYDTSDTLQKTVSESFLEQYSLARYNEVNGGTDEVPRVGGWPFASSECFRAGTVLPSSSCESVASESSVVFTDLLPSPCHPIVGYLCIGLQYENRTSEDGKDLLVTVQEAKDLVGPPNPAPMDTFVKLFLTPDETNALQTKVCKHTDRSVYHETFRFWVANHNAARRSLWFYVYHNSVNSQTLIGEAELQIDESIQRPITTWLKLIDSSYRKASLGELMISLSYLPTAERLTVVVVKARNLALKNRGPASAKRGNAVDEPDALVKDVGHEPDSGGNVFVKVYLLQNDRKISKKKTSVKRAEQFPIYNEAIIFSLPPYMLNAVQIRLSVVQMVQRAETCVAHGTESTRESLADGLARKPSIKLISLGHVIVGSGTTGKGLRHWHQMLTALRKPVAMWHGLRNTSERKRKDTARYDAATNLVDVSVD